VVVQGDSGETGGGAGTLTGGGRDREVFVKDVVWGLGVLRCCARCFTVDVRAIVRCR
jgi:hypothetical protein